MNENLKAILERLADKAANADKADDAMKYAQAALNVSHTIATLYHTTEKDK